MAIFLAGDVVVTVVSFLFAYYLRFYSNIIPVKYGVPAFQQYVNIIPLVLIVWPVIFHFHGLYQIRRTRSSIDEFFSVTASVGIAVAILWGILLYYGTYHLSRIKGDETLEPSRVLFLYFLMLDIAGIMLVRAGIRKVLEEMRRRGFNIKKVLIVGAGKLGETVASRIQTHEELGYDIVGFLDDDPEKLVVSGFPVVGRTSEVAPIVDQLRIDYLFIALPLSAHDTIKNILHTTRNEIVDIKVVPDILEYVAIRAGIEDLDGVPIINLSDVPLRGFDSFVKRIMDIMFGLGRNADSCGFFPIVFFMVKFRSPGPIFFKQERMGLDGKSFQMYKFRTMEVNAELETGPVMSQANDPRMTPFGRVFKKIIYR